MPNANIQAKIILFSYRRGWDYWDAYNAKVEEGAEITDEGVEEAFEVVTEVSEE